MVGFIVQYQSPLTFPYKAVLNGGFGVDIGGVDVLDADVAFLNGVGGIDNAGIGNLRIGR